MAKSGTDEHQSTVAIRKGTNGPCTAAYLAIHPFRQVIHTDPAPVFGRKIHIGIALSIKVTCFILVFVVTVKMFR